MSDIGQEIELLEAQIALQKQQLAQINNETRTIKRKTNKGTNGIVHMVKMPSTFPLLLENYFSVYKEIFETQLVYNNPILDKIELSILQTINPLDSDLDINKYHNLATLYGVLSVGASCLGHDSLEIQFLERSKFALQKFISEPSWEALGVLNLLAYCLSFTDIEKAAYYTSLTLRYCDYFLNQQSESNCIYKENLNDIKTISLVFSARITSNREELSKIIDKIYAIKTQHSFISATNILAGDLLVMIYNENLDVDSKSIKNVLEKLEKMESILKQNTSFSPLKKVTFFAFCYAYKAGIYLKLGDKEKASEYANQSTLLNYESIHKQHNNTLLRFIRDLFWPAKVHYELGNKDYLAKDLALIESVQVLNQFLYHYPFYKHCLSIFKANFVT